MFSFHTDTFGEFTRHKILNETTGEYFTVIPECGGILQELVLQKNGQLYSIIDGVTEDEVPNNIWFKSSILFPFPSRIPDGKYTFQGKTYQLPINEPSRNSALHGLVFDKKFEMGDLEQNQYYGRLHLQYELTDSNIDFPFSYKLEITYEMMNNFKPIQVIFKPFHIIFKVTNTGETDMPLGIGWHPYFKTGSVIDDLELILPTRQYAEFDKNLIPTGKIKTMSRFQKGSLIGKTELDTGFLQKSKKTLETKLIDTEKELTIKMVQNSPRKGHGFIQLYTPPHRQSIAIEPQSCGANAFNNGDGLIILKPKEKCEMTIELSLE